MIALIFAKGTCRQWTDFSRLLCEPNQEVVYVREIVAEHANHK
jgi:hypothetical protein